MTAKKTTAKKTTKKPGKTTEKKGEINFPNVKPPSLAKKNLPRSPVTLNVCGNVVSVNDYKAGEADPKVLRRRARTAAKRRGNDIDETRI